MKVKYTILSVLAAVFAFAASPVQAQDIKIGLVDMQRALNEYKKTQQRTDEINARASILQKEGEARGNELKALEDKIRKETEVIQNPELGQPRKEEAAKAREALLKEFGTKQKEALEAGQRAAAELAKARKEMEVELVGEITKVMEATAQSKGADLVFDKSFLPRANKAIIYTSANVLDMTDEIVAQLNK